MHYLIIDPNVEVNFIRKWADTSAELKSVVTMDYLTNEIHQ